MEWLISIETWGTVTGLLCVYLTARENLWAWPIGIVNVILFALSFYEVKLYADMILQFVFLLLSIVGWYTWLTGDKNTKDVRKTRSMTRNEAIVAICIIGVGGIAWAYLLDTFTDASIPYLDATVAMASIVAQYFLSRKVLQNWILWIVIDVASVGMYAYKELYLYSGLYAVFLAIASHGYITWKKEMNKEAVPHAQGAVHR